MEAHKSGDVSHLSGTKAARRRFLCVPLLRAPSVTQHFRRPKLLVGEKIPMKTVAAYEFVAVWRRNARRRRTVDFNSCDDH